MSENENVSTSRTDNLNDQRFELVAQLPGQVKFPSKPRKRQPRPRRNEVEQLTLPGVPASDDQTKA